MLVAKNSFLVEVESQFVKPKIKGFDFFIDTDFNPKLLSTKIGKIHTMSIGVTPPSKYDNPLSKGDLVVFGHLVCQKKNKVFENVFMCPYHSIFAKIVEEQLQPLEEVIFCEPVVEERTQIGAFEIPNVISEKKAKVFELSNEAKKAGIQKGDIIFFTKNADYGVEVAGKLLYMMRIRNVIGIERDGELRTFRKKLLVKNITELGKVGGIEKIYANTNLQTGIVVDGGITGIENGTELTYMNGSASAIEWKGQDYAFIDEVNIKFLK